MSDRGRRKGRSRRSCWLSLLGIIVLLLGTLAGGFAWFYNNPISNDTLHTRVLRRLERISGLSVAYDSAALRLSSGQYKITNLRFMDPAQPEVPVLTVGEVLAKIRPWELISNPESVITEVVLKNPSRLDLVYSVDSIKLGERTQFLVDAVRKAQPPGSQRSGRLPFDELKIENVELAFTEAEGILPDPNPPEAAMVMLGDLRVENEGTAALDFQFTGSADQPAAADDDDQTTPAMASGVQASIILDDTDEIKITGVAERIALHKMFREMPETSLRAGDLVFNLTANREGDDRSIKADVQSGSLAYASPEKGVLIEDEAIKLVADLTINTSASIARARSLSIDSSGALASISGVTSYGSQPGYDVTVSAERLGSNYRQMIEQLLPQGWDVESGRESVAANLRITGTDRLQSVDGRMALRGVSLETPALPAPLKNMSGDIEFAQDSVKLVDVTADYAGARMALDGTFNGDLWQTKAGSLDLRWSTVLSLDQVLNLHAAQMARAGHKVTGSGAIRGNGTWQQEISFANPAESGLPAVEGEIVMENVALQYPLLPAPIAGLSGTAIIDDNILSIRNLTGKMQGSELAIDGKMIGNKFFWREPEVSASLISRLDLAQLGPYLTADQKANLDKYQLSGKAQTQMIMNGPLKDLGSRMTGVVHISDVSFAPGLSFMQGSFSNVSGVVTWDGSILHLDEVSGLLNEETVNLAGDISAKRIDLQVNSHPSLKTVQATFPYLDKYLEMSGGTAVDLRFTAGDEGEAQPGALSTVMEAAGALAEQSVNDKTFSLNGEIEFDNASIRHIAMPIARKEDGREIPAGIVTKMNGKLRVNNDTLSVPAESTISCSFADTPNCRLSGTIKIRPNNFPSMNVKISSGGTLKLDTWATGWGKGMPRLQSPPMTGSKYDLVAEIVAPSVVFRGQEAGRSRGRVLFNMTQNETPRVTRFEDVVIQGNRPGQGRIIGSGRIDSFVWNESQYPKWQAALDVQMMPLESMLTAVFRSPSTVFGTVTTGNIRLEGISNNARAVRGTGSAFMRNLELGRTAVIQQLGQTTGRNLGGQLFQTAQAATFNIGNGALSSTDLALETNGLMLEMRGDYYFAGDPSRGIPAKTIDGSLRLRLFKSVFGSIPIIGQMADLADEVTNAFLLAFRVTGTAASPRVTPVALPVFQGGS